MGDLVRSSITASGVSSPGVKEAYEYPDGYLDRRPVHTAKGNDVREWIAIHELGRRLRLVESILDVLRDVPLIDLRV